MKKLGLWLASICLIVCSSFAVVGCDFSGNSSTGAVQEYVELSENSISMEVYSQYTLKTTTNVNKEIVWTTSDASVVTVENGVINALSVGIATVTATAGLVSDKCTVVVTHLSSFPELVLSNTSLELVEGGAGVTVDAMVAYKGEVMDCAFTWETENPSIATVENGKIVPVGIGETTITVATECLGEILVKNIHVVVNIDEQIIASKALIDLQLAKINDSDRMVDTFTVQSYVKGEVNEDAVLTIVSSDENVATVSVEGKNVTVAAVGLGSCTINLSYDSENGKIQSFVAVTVSRAKVVVDKVVDTTYIGENTQLDLSQYDLVGDFEGVYYAGQLVSAKDGTFTKDFVEANNHGFGIDVELRTDVAVYYAKISISISFAETGVMLAESSKDLARYDGDVTALGFDAGTSVSMHSNTGSDAAWENRLMPKDSSKILGFDHWIVEFSLGQEPTGSANSGYIMSSWVGGTHFVLVNVSKMSVVVFQAGEYTGSDSEHKANSCVSVYDANGKIPSKLVANQKYYFEMHLEHAGSSDNFSFAFNDALDIYVGNSFFCTDEYYDETIAPTRDNSTPADPVFPEDPNMPDVSQGDHWKEVATYDGDVTKLGFPAGTDVVYVLETTPSLGWDNRVIMKADTSKDILKFSFVPSKDIDAITLWPANGLATHGSYRLEPTGASTADADANRKIRVLDENGQAVSKFEKGNLYVVYFYLCGAGNVQVGAFSDVTIYLGNIESIGEDEMPKEPLVMQGENRLTMPTYAGDVTALGFAADTIVYEIVGAQSNANDVKLVAKVDSTGDAAFAKMDIVFSKDTTSFGLWITAANVHLGYYTVTPSGFNVDGIADPTRNVFVTDANGDRVTSFKANTIYTLYVGLDGREVTVQVTTWAALTMYVANIDCITEAEAPVEPAPPVQGKEISILFIGNSFSDDTEAYMVDILLNLGYTNVNIGNLYIGGCSIDTHYDNILKNTNAYDFRMRSHNGKKYTEYETVSVGGEKRSISYAIAYKNWDVISVQQASGESGKVDSYKNLNALVSEVTKQATNKQVEIVFNMTWAYQGNSTHAQFPDYNSDQMTMYNAIINAVQTTVEYTVVPNGTAIQNARTSLLGDTLTRDGYHLDLKVGRYIAGLTFVAKVTGADLADLTYVPGGVNELQFTIAIESVQNALDNPFEVTQSEMTEENLKDPDVYAGGSNNTAVTKYKGDVTELGFAEDTTVYEYVGVDSSADKAAMKVDSANYDYVEVDFVIAQGSGYFFLHGLKGGNWHNNGTSYVVDPGWIRLGDGNNTASDRVIEVYDANGNKVTSLMKNNVVYTLRVYIKVGDLDEIRISMSGSTIYFANVKQGNDGVSEPDDTTPDTNPVVDSNGNPLPLYNGDVTALGFAAGATVYESVQDNRTDNWSAGTELGLTMEQQAIKIKKSLDEDYASVYFSLSRDLTNPNYAFFAWWYDANGANKGAAGFLKADGKFESRSESPADLKIVAYDMDGNVATSFVANTVYEMRWYSKQATAFKIGCCEKNGESITVYYADPSSGNDEATVPSLEQGDNRTPLYAYSGDVTALGFAAGTTVYKLEHNTPDDPYGYGWGGRVSIPAPGTQDYVTIEFVLANAITGNSPVFHAWGPKGVPSIVAIWTSTTEGGVITNMDGSMIVELKAGTHYLLHVACKDMDEVQIGFISKGNTAYIANVSYNNGKLGAVKISTTPTYSTDGGHSSEAAAIYAGDVTALGFAAGTTVYEQVIADGWNDRVAIAVDNSYDYVDIQFSLAEDTTLCVWFNNAPLSMLQGNYTVDMQGQAVACNNAAERKLQVLDQDGNVVTAMTTNTVYTLRVYIDGLVQVQLSTFSGARNIYYGEVTFGNDE